MKAFAQLFIFLINIYILLLIIRVILSWLNLPQTQWISLINKATDPVLNFFRKNFPIRIGVLDISIIIPFILLTIIKKILIDVFISGVPFGMFYMIGLIILVADSAISFIAFILFISTIVLLVININSTYINNPIINSMKTIVLPIVSYIRKKIKINYPKADIIYLIITAGVILIAGIILHSILMWLFSTVGAIEANSMFQGREPDIEF